MRLFVDSLREKWLPLLAETPYFGHLVTPTNNNMARVTSTGFPWGADNECFGGLNRKKFLRLLDKVAGVPQCRFVVAPDVVGDATATRELFDEWEPTIREVTGQPVAYVAQNGQEDFEPPWDRFDALFVGGSKDEAGEWKESPDAMALIREAKRRGKWVHMGRVNTRRRMQIAYDVGCDSIDGSGFSRFAPQRIPLAIRWLAEIHARPPACEIQQMAAPPAAA